MTRFVADLIQLDRDIEVVMLAMSIVVSSKLREEVRQEQAKEIFLSLLHGSSFIWNEIENRDVLEILAFELEN